jgi:hypothetical protein
VHKTYLEIRKRIRAGGDDTRKEWSGLFRFSLCGPDEALSMLARDFSRAGDATYYPKGCCMNDDKNSLSFSYLLDSVRAS